MKKLLVSVSIIGIFLVSQTATADDRRYRRGYDHYGYNSHYSPRYNSPRYNRGNYHRPYNNFYSRRANPYHYGYRDRRGDAYINFSYGNHYPRYRRRHYDSGAFFGGLVLGSLLSYPDNYPSYSSRRYSSPYYSPQYYSPQYYDTVTYRSRPVTRSREVIVVRELSVRSSTAVASGRRLLRDLEGNCFERVVNARGNEVRIQLDSSECDFQ